MTTTHTAHTGDYEPPWLIRLREEIPEAARSFDFDPKRVTRFDQMLSGVADQDRKFELVRMAYNSGLDPNDPIFSFVFTALNLQQMFSADHHEFLTAMRSTAEESRELLRDLRREGISIENKITRLEESASEIAQTMEQSVEYSLNAIKEEADKHIDNRIALRLTEKAQEFADAASEHVENAGQAVQDAAAHAKSITDSVAPLVALTKRFEKDALTLWGGYKIPRNVGILIAGTALVCFFLGWSAFGWFANTWGMGLNSETRANIAAGKTYIRFYPHIHRSSQDDIQQWLRQNP